jgi:hypothetical protein
MLHVSLPADIIQLFGTGIAGTVLTVFELGEKYASQRAKDALSDWLRTFDVRKAGALTLRSSTQVRSDNCRNQSARAGGSDSTHRWAFPAQAAGGTETAAISTHTTERRVMESC